MSTEHEDTERSSFEPIRRYFKSIKVAISNAIRKPFPFFAVLRDTELITNKMYEDFRDTCTNLVPVQEVVYRALEVLEKRLDWQVLWVLFCVENIKAYPDLEHIWESLKNVLPQNELWSREIERRDLNSQLSLEQGPGNSCSGESLTSSPTGPSSSNGWRSNDEENTTLTQGNQTENHQFPISQIHNAVVLSENGLSENLNETVRINHLRRDTTGNDIDDLQRPQAAIQPGPGSEQEESCELEVQLSDRDAGLEPHIPLPCSNERAELLSHGIKTRPCSVNLVDIKQENFSVFLSGEHQTHTRTDHSQASEVIDLTRDNSDDENSCSEESTSATCQSKPVNSRNPPRSTHIHRRRGTSHTDSSSTRKRQRTNTTYAENNSTSGKHGRKIRKKRDKIGKCVTRNIKIPMPTIWKKAYMRRRINSSSRRGRIRGLRDPRQNNVDFRRPELPVICGTAKGTLYKEKFKKGIHVKSIRSDNRRFTPREFEIRGNRERSKNWKKSIRCDGYTLKVLIENKYVPDPPKKKRECTVCRGGRNLYPCDSCGKFYHEKCHIPPVEDKRGPWSCVFCKIKDQAKCQENQAFHKESEVLKRKMLPEEQLKCELLLLTLYCAPICCFFIRKPNQRKEDFPDVKEHMWLDKIKNRLNKKVYYLVQHFVADMRLIFHNHSIFYKKQVFSNLGDTIRKIFEKNFKRIFSINETSK
ncbi:LOW QUALITY PROTEIN: nuclear autoantigen Sp-100-like [Arvicola amphibius]|uniref:LOW QUALITY PROTEIN: nuclear autoantigen Sp-100-like n=1 Tax=Arvicola amphibius TaxID=1047088 RepID=UPI0018E3870A|nr:LOW QUALITY PROTEIN: nuclear autoantigen Sp-100-like [Arvicola amphibius]